MVPRTASLSTGPTRCDYVHMFTAVASGWVSRTLTSSRHISVWTHHTYAVDPVLGHEPRWVAHSGQFAPGSERYVVVGSIMPLSIHTERVAVKPPYSGATRGDDAS